MRYITLLLALVIVLAGVARPVAAQGVDIPKPMVSQEEVQKAMDGLVAYLYSIQNDRGEWEEVAVADDLLKGEHGAKKRLEYGGRTALVVLALLYAGEKPDDERLQKAIKFLAEVELKGTYAVGIRASVWSKMNDPKLRPLVKRDAEWLVEATTGTDRATKKEYISGAFAYSKPYPGYFDHSNTQYGVLGLRDADIRGLELPPQYWLAIQEHMIKQQQTNGGWGYGRDAKVSETYGNMTVGCLANLYITMDRLSKQHEAAFDGRVARGCGRVAVPEAVDKGLAWLDRNLPVDFGIKPKEEGDAQTYRGHGMNTYYLYGLERCGHASGRKTFGGLNWFQHGAKFLINAMGERGHLAGYYGNEVNSSWALLFLSKGQAPVLYNKLDYGKPDWNNDPMDIPNLSKFIGEELEMRINHQVISMEDPVEEWLDAPVLYISGHEALEFTDEQKAKLRLYTDSGGTVLAEACCSNANFIRGFQALASEVWPEWELQMLDRRHPVHSFQYEIRGRLPRIQHMNNGCRSFVFLAMEDMSCAWHQNQQMRYKAYFQFGLNLARYASDKQPLRSRLVYVPTVVEELTAQGKTIETPVDLAKITVADWSLPTSKRNTDIRAMRHLSETLKEAANVEMELVSIEDNKLDRIDEVQVIHLSGHGGFVVSDENIALLKAFVDRGGLIWADPQCGREAFSKSLDELIGKLFAGNRPRLVLQTDSLVTGKGLPRAGFDVAQVAYKQSLQMKENRPSLLEVQKDGRRVMVFSKYDLTCGMDGHNCANCMGPQRNDALKIAANIVISALPKGEAGAADDWEQ